MSPRPTPYGRTNKRSEPIVTRQEQFIAVIRTAVPAFVGYILALLISAIPVVGDWIAAIDKQIAAALPNGGVTVLGLLQAAAVAVVVGAYYWLARLLGTRWPIVERFLLGSSRQPVAYTPPATAGDDQGHADVRSVVAVGTILAMVLAAVLLIGAPSANAATLPKAHTSAIVVKAWPSFTDNPAGATPLPSLYLHRKTVKKVATAKCDSGRAYQATFYRWATIDRMHTPIFSQPIYLLRCL